MHLPLSGDARAFYIIDLSCFIYRHFYAPRDRPRVDGDAANGVLDLVRRILEYREPGYLAIAVDADGPNFREAMAPGYKTNRLRKDQAAIDAEVQRFLDVTSVPAVTAPSFEADDVIATLVDHGTRAGLTPVIVGIDKDLKQLIGEGTIMWDGNASIWGPNEVTAEYGVQPESIADYLAIVGDIADHVPGVPGLGKLAAKEIISTFGSLEDAIEALDRPPGPDDGWLYGKRPKYKKLLGEHREVALLSKKLVTLALNAPIPPLEDLRCQM
jgi:DNA polymerase-1